MHQHHPESGFAGEQGSHVAKDYSEFTVYHRSTLNY